MRIAIIRTLGLLLAISSAAVAQQAVPPSSSRCVPATPSTNWAQFHFDPCHTGYNPFETILGPGNVGSLLPDWMYFPPGEEIVSSPAVVDGIAYFGTSGDGAAYALDAETGVTKWINGCGGQSNDAGSPAVADGRVYVACRDAIRALNAATGRLLWEEKDPFGDFPLSEITVSNGRVYVASYHEGSYHTQHVYALDAVTGAVLWKVSGDEWTVKTPAVADGLVYVGCDPKHLCAFDGSTGVLVWEYIANGNVSAAAVADGLVYFYSWNGSLPSVYALNAATGELVWQRPIGTLTSINDLTASTPAVANGFLYIAVSRSDGFQGDMYALDANTGVLRWTYGVPGRIESSPAVANGVVYFGSDNLDRNGFSGDVYALDARTGAMLWKYHTENVVVSSPAVVNGRLYVASLAYMYAFHLPGQ